MTKYTTYLPAILMAHKAWFKRKRSSQVHCKRKGSKKRKRSSSPLSKMVEYTTYLPAILMAHKAWFKRKRSSQVHCKRKGSKKRKRSSSPLSKMVDENQPVCFLPCVCVCVCVSPVNRCGMQTQVNGKFSVSCVCACVCNCICVVRVNQA